MKYVKILLAVAFVFTLCTAFTLKGGHKPVYAFGVSASFTDTLVYYTEIQVLDSVSLDKNGFLPKRDLYSYQLKNYLELEKGLPNRTCMIYFSENKKKLSKEAVKVMNKYKKNKSVALQKINTGDFKFSKPEE
ncbi:hypothetical protein [Bacteroides sp.]